MTDKNLANSSNAAFDGTQKSEKFVCISYGGDKAPGHVRNPGYVIAADEASQTPDKALVARLQEFAQNHKHEVKVIDGGSTVHVSVPETTETMKFFDEVCKASKGRYCHRLVSDSSIEQGMENDQGAPAADLPDSSL